MCIFLCLKPMAPNICMCRVAKILLGDRKKLTTKANMSGRSATWDENVEFVITGGEGRSWWLQVLQRNPSRSALQAVPLQGIMLLHEHSDCTGGCYAVL